MASMKPKIMPAGRGPKGPAGPNPMKGMRPPGGGMPPPMPPNNPGVPAGGLPQNAPMGMKKGGAVKKGKRR